MDKANIKLSVCMSAYNAGKYIEQALDSILMQKTNFVFEILIGEDPSKDNTRTLIEAYRDRYPDIVRLFLTTERIGANATLLKLIENSRGEYVAQIDADDFLLNENRLQAMADFLDTHPQHAACINNYKVVDEEGKTTVEDAYGEDYKHVEMDHFLYKAAFGGMAMWRRSSMPVPIPAWLYKVGPKTDFAIMMVVSAGKLVGYLPERFMAYRRHSQSLGSLSNKEEMLNRDIYMCKRFREYYAPLDKKYDAIFKSGASYYGYILSYSKLSKGRVFSFLYYFIMACINWPTLSAKTHKDYLFMASPELFYKIKSFFGRK